MKKIIFIMIIISILIMSLSACSLLNNNNNLNNNQNDNQNIDNQNDITKCNVNFNLNDYYGILAPSTQYIEKGQKAIKPVDPIRAGYTFDGWYTDNNGVNGKWDFENTIVNEHQTLYAKWIKDEYTISFNLAGGNGETPASLTLGYLDKVTEPDMDKNTSVINYPTKDGYVFAGWWIGDSENNYTQEWNFSTDLPSKNCTLYAGWGTANFNNDYSFIELNNCIKILGFINSTIPENEIIIPSTINGKSVLSIAKRAFMDFSGTSKLTLPSTLTTINDEAFYRCLSISDLIIPDSVTSIGKMAFHSCENLYSLKIGKNVKSIGEKAFYQCTSLACNNTDKLIIPSNVLSIEKEAFLITGTAIKNLEIESGLIYIGESAFSHAYILKLKIPDSVEIIGKFAFQYCGYLTKIEIGKGIKQIDYDSFYYCNDSLYIIMNSIKVPTLGSKAVFGEFLIYNDVPSRKNFFISVPEESIDAYKNDENWGYYYKTRITAYTFDDSTIVFPDRP